MDYLMSKVREIYEQFDASHDFQHIERVYQNALAILHTEPAADAEVVKIAVLLHDVSDKKYTDSKEQEEQLIAELPVSEEKSNIFEIVLHKYRLMVEMS